MLSFTWLPLSQAPLFSQFVLLKGAEVLSPPRASSKLRAGQSMFQALFNEAVSFSAHDSVGTEWAGVGVCTLPSVRGVRTGTQHRGKGKFSVEQCL